MDYTRILGSRWGSASFKQMFMEKSLFDDVNLNDSSFLNLALLNTVFDSCTLNGSKFKKLAMTDSEFHSANLGGTKFFAADLRNVEIGEDCELEGMTINGISVVEMLKLYKEKQGAEKNFSSEKDVKEQKQE